MIIKRELKLKNDSPGKNTSVFTNMKQFVTRKYIYIEFFFFCGIDHDNFQLGQHNNRIYHIDSISIYWCQSEVILLRVSIPLYMCVWGGNTLIKSNLGGKDLFTLQFVSHYPEKTGQKQLKEDPGGRNQTGSGGSIPYSCAPVACSEHPGPPARE